MPAMSNWGSEFFCPPFDFYRFMSQEPGVKVVSNNVIQCWLLHNSLAENGDQSLKNRINLQIFFEVGNFDTYICEFGQHELDSKVRYRHA